MEPPSDEVLALMLRLYSRHMEQVCQLQQQVAYYSARADVMEELIAQGRLCRNCATPVENPMSLNGKKRPRDDDHERLEMVPPAERLPPLANPSLGLGTRAPSTTESSPHRSIIKKECSPTSVSPQVRHSEPRRDAAPAANPYDVYALLNSNPVTVSNAGGENVPQFHTSGFRSFAAPPSSDVVNVDDISCTPADIREECELFFGSSSHAALLQKAQSPAAGTGGRALAIEGKRAAKEKHPKALWKPATGGNDASRVRGGFGVAIPHTPDEFWDVRLPQPTVAPKGDSKDNAPIHHNVDEVKDDRLQS